MTNLELNLLLKEIKKIKMEEMEFCTGTGGIPDYNKKLEKDIIEADEKFQYETPENGNAYSGWIKIICGKTNFVDHHGDVIYISKSGFIFTEDYREGSPSDFDRSILDTPDIRINLDYFNINEYLKNKNNELPKSLLKNISKTSETEFYYKNVKFMEDFTALLKNNNLKQVKLVLRKDGLAAPPDDETLYNIYWGLLDINGNRMPLPIFIDILFGSNYCSNWSDKKHLKRLGKIYNEMKTEFNYC